MHKIKFIFFTLLLAPLIFGGKVFAANTTFNGITLSPAIVNIDLAKGQANTNFELTLKNTTKKSVILSVSSLDFKSLNETGGVAFINSTTNSTKYGLASWLVAEDSITLKAGETKSTKITIQNRDDLSPGGHYAAILFKVAGGDSKSDTNHVDVNQVVSALVFVKKTGGEIYNINLQKLPLKTSWLNMPSNINLFFKNNGNIQTVPRGLVVIKSPFSKELARGIINTDSSMVLPESTRIYRTTINKTAIAWLPGIYKVEVSYRYDGAADYLRYNSQFLYVNIKFVGICLLVLAILAFAGFGLIKFIKVKQQKNKEASLYPQHLQHNKSQSATPTPVKIMDIKKVTPKDK